MDKQDSEKPEENEKDLNEDFARVVEAGYESSLGQSEESSIGFAEQLERQTEQNRTASFQYQLLTRTRRVWATNILVAINVIVYVIQLTQGIDWLSPEVPPLINWGANYAPLTFAGEWWRIVTCMFLHAGIAHLLMNVYALKMLGNFIERLVGTWSFLALYFVTGIAGSLTSLYWHSSESVSVGASGAICGIFGVLVGYVFWQRHSFPPVFVKAVRNAIVLVIVLNGILGFFIENVDEAAHLGGTVLGVSIGIFLSQPFGSFDKSKSRKRSIVLAVVGAIGTATAIGTFPEAPVDFFKLEEDRVDVFQKVYKTHNRLIRTIQDQKNEDLKPVEILQNEIISPFEEMLNRFETIENIPDDRKEYVEQNITLMQLRLSAWQSLLESLKAQNFIERNWKRVEWFKKWKKADEFDKSLQTRSSNDR